ncbi:uncharacterized protein At3g28850-like [Macadamia integrifolia]|uniref:uncharacterized protein At3g28850-like n=1 Tax=Macadamia integrifolia TaxID=60698 RepID=UPI001C500145|nr:uncharacterized protein At3g28850-like [Macadamia integrifolia]
MGCVSSKLFSKDFNQEEGTVVGNGDYSNHIVSLTSSTYGVLSLDQESVKETVKETMISPPHHVVSPKLQRKVIEDPEIINTWKLMEDLEDEIPISVQTKKSPTSRVAGADARNPSKFFNEINSPKKQKKYSGKENKNRQSGYDGSVGGTEHNPKQVLKPISSLENVQKATSTLKTPTKVTPVDLNSSSFRFHPVISNPRKSLSPLFDPELLASFERELNEEGEQIKKMVFPEPRIQKTPDSESMLEAFEKKCPPGGENAVVIYTTTLRGIRKTFEDCNNVRSVIECHNVHMIERDISMDSGFREELRRLMGKKEVRVPVVFVKGRLIGGADEVVKMEEEGKLGMLFRGIPRALAGCEGCGGLRFVMCVDCSGSCKVLDQDSNKMVKCGECNENGLIQCPICC